MTPFISRTVNFGTKMNLIKSIYFYKDDLQLTKNTLCITNINKCICSISFFYKKLKILDKKKSYKASVPEWFVNDRVNETLLTLKQSFIATLPPGENEIVSKPIIQNTKTNFLLHFIIFSMQPTL